VSQQNPGQLIQVPNTLRLKVGGRFGAIDPSAIAKAEAALKSLSGNFAQWLQDEVVKLESHDLKGLGATYEFPLITRIAASLCRLIDDKQKRLSAPIALIDAHIDAVKAAIRDNIKTDDHPVGEALVTALERRVAEMGL
jgi:hypothetical protein